MFNYKITNLLSILITVTAVSMLVTVVLASSTASPSPAVHTRCKQPGRVALTFDDAFVAATSHQLLEVLRELEAPATFFVSGPRLDLDCEAVEARLARPPAGGAEAPPCERKARQLEKNRKALRSALGDGHQIGSHGYHHAPLRDLEGAALRAQMQTLEQVVADAADGAGRLARFVRSAQQERMTAEAVASLGELGYSVVGARLDVHGGRGTRPSEEAQRQLWSRALEGSSAATDSFIVELRDALPDDELAAEIAALHAAVPAWRRAGYEFVSLDDCLALTTPRPPPRPPRPPPSPPPREATLRACLLRGVAPGVRAQSVGGHVVWPDDAAYAKARVCKNLRADLLPSPLAVVRPTTPAEAAAAVSCAVAAGVEACARAGGHGTDNDAGCTGGLLIDVQELRELRVDPASKVVSFGAGFTLGQLYYHLHREHNLAVAGGTVNDVGAAGLFLGCGRGFFSQLHGLACDTVLGIEYVDARGDLRGANASANTDMYWLARGGGGNFAGVVTRFTVQAFEVPSLHGHDCAIPLEHGKELLRGWGRQLQASSMLAARTYSHIQTWEMSGIYNFSALCLGCDEPTRAAYDARVEAILASAGGSVAAYCVDGVPHTRSWTEQLLLEAGVEDGAIERSPKALTDREQGWGAINLGKDAIKTGAAMGYTWEMSEAVLEALHHGIHVDGTGLPWGAGVMVYAMGGEKISSVAPKATAYGPREAKWVLHYKHQWEYTNASHAQLALAHHERFAKALARTELPCSSFYNYIDTTLPCARVRGAVEPNAFLAAYHSDVPRMLRVKAAADRRGTFRSHFEPILPPPPAPPTPPPTLPPPTPPPPPPPPPPPHSEATARDERQPGARQGGEEQHATGRPGLVTAQGQPAPSPSSTTVRDGRPLMHGAVIVVPTTGTEWLWDVAHAWWVAVVALALVQACRYLPRPRGIEVVTAAKGGAKRRGGGSGGKRTKKRGGVAASSDELQPISGGRVAASDL